MPLSYISDRRNILLIAWQDGGCDGGSGGVRGQGLRHRLRRWPVASCGRHLGQPGRPDHTLPGWPQGPDLTCPALPCPALPCPALPCPALPCPALPCPALPCPALPCPALPCPALPCPALPCPALPCPALPCPALSCPVHMQHELTSYILIL